MREENRTHFSLSALDPGALEIYIPASVSLKLHQVQPLRIAHRNGLRFGPALQPSMNAISPCKREEFR